MFKCYYKSPLGKIILVSDGENLTGLYFENQNEPQGELNENLPIFIEAKTWLNDYFAGKAPKYSIKIKLNGTPFQQQVWKILLQIPYGKTVTYGEIAKELAVKMNIKKMSAQAVGGAVSKNPISVIVPCHRVVGKNGKLTGYAGGIERKIYLLEIEGHKINKENQKKLNSNWTHLTNLHKK